MSLMEQHPSSIPTVSSESQSSVTEVKDVANSSNPLSDDIQPHYNTPNSTKMTMNRTYSPVPGAHGSGTLYSPSFYNQLSTGMHHQTATLPSPPFIHNAAGAPSSSTSNLPYSNHYQHYPGAPNLPLTSLLPAPSHRAMRTVYLGNLAPDTQISDILDQIRSGVLETVRPLPEKNCVFLTFVDAGATAHFYHQGFRRLLTIKGMEFKLGWGKPSDLPTNIGLALQHGASRNVFLGSLDENVSEDVIREDLKRFGTIEHVRLLREKKIAFVHFLSIANAIKCVNNLPNEDEWQNRRISYGRDRCFPNVINTTAAAMVYTNASTQPPLPQPYHHPIHVQHDAYHVRYSPSFAYDPYTGATIESYVTTPSPPQVHHHHHHHHQPTVPSTNTAHVIPSPLTPALAPSMHGNMTAATATAAAAIYHHHSSQSGKGSTNLLTGVSNRTIYLGNIHPDTTCEDICNVVRGGILSQIRYMVDKHIAFLVFVDPMQALQFFNQSNYYGMVIKSRQLKIGWGKPCSLSGNVIQAVHNGGSRNVYLGNMEGDESMSEEKLKQDFSEYGDIELVNTLKEKNCAFINFTSIAAAIRAIEGIRTKEEYKRFRINYGKDRCGNPPRSSPSLPKSTSELMETTTTTTSSSSTSTTNSVTTPPSTRSNITHTVLPSNEDDLLGLDGSDATVVNTNGLEMTSAAFTSNDSHTVDPLTDLVTDLSRPDLVTNAALN
ncbi:hypothetical protein BCR42DRAFT_493262 [Absidia repens]|uniref:RRM domain-containing protein n=1 Tax=Absidia repens TaxID=90262 RepID=A0A1X2ICL6_9FUNG|nr:hypothetical protein BCR42DRAFT_493262 [Absidia repens]